jgi:DNA-binding MarR family transcriptional regulator
MEIEQENKDWHKLQQEKMLNDIGDKKLSDITVREFVNFLPLLKKQFTQKRIASNLIRDSIENLLRTSVTPYSMYTIAKKVKFSYYSVRSHIKEMEKKGLVMTQKVVTKDKRNQTLVIWNRGRQ